MQSNLPHLPQYMESHVALRVFSQRERGRERKLGMLCVSAYLMVSSAAAEINRTIKRLGQKTNCCVGHKIKRYVWAIYIARGKGGDGEGSPLQKLMMCQAVDAIQQRVQQQQL